MGEVANVKDEDNRKSEKNVVRCMGASLIAFAQRCEARSLVGTDPLGGVRKIPRRAYLGISQLHVRIIQEPAVVRRITQGHARRGRRQDLRIRRTRASTRSIKRTFSAANPHSVASINLEPFLNQRPGLSKDMFAVRLCGFPNPENYRRQDYEWRIS